MILEKYSPQTPLSGFPSQLCANDNQSSRPSVTRLPKIPNTPSNQNPCFINDLLPFNNRLGVNIPNLERITPSPFEHPIGRGPKIYTKNLPEVFTSNATGNRSKRNAGMKERNKGESTDQLSIDVATPSGNTTLTKKQFQLIFSPAHVAHIPKSSTHQKGKEKSDQNPRAMKENIEGIVLKFDNESVSKVIPSNQNGKYIISPQRRSKRIRIRTNIEIGNLVENTESVRDKKKEDEKHQIKKMIVFKKKAANTSESKFFDSHNEEVKIRHINKSTPPNKASGLELSELITIRKVKNTLRNGVIKRMMHVPSFTILDVLEESIEDIGVKENYEIKDWINDWELNFSQSNHVAQVYFCFWNSPEYCISIVLEAAKNGFLSDVIDSYGSLPEKALQTVAKGMLIGIVEVQSKLCKPHGNITLQNVLIDGFGTPKIAPGISSLFNSSSHVFHSNSPKPAEGHSAVLKKFEHGQFDYKSSHSITANHHDFSQDVFDFGFSILQCAIGDFSVFDLNSPITLESVKSVITNPLVQKRRDLCCLIHSEDVIRKFLTHANPGSLPDLKRRVKSKKGSKVLDDLESSSSSDASFLSILEILTSLNRLSGSFINFLCHCLKIDPTQRPKAEDLLNHRFLSDNHQSNGPQVSFKEILALGSKGAGDYFRSVEREDERRMHKLGEALKVVLLNKNVKEKFDMVLKRSGKSEIDESKLMELANELGTSMFKLKRKIHECLQDFQE